MGKTILVNYAGALDPRLNAQLGAAQLALNASAVRYGGIDEISAWDRARLVATPFYGQNRSILDRPRGGGYWLWKPFVILTVLRSAARDDLVVYWDVGRTTPHQFRRSIEPLVQWCREHGGLLP